MKAPDILLPGKMADINTYILNRTGCFAFLTPDEQWQFSEPKTGRGAVELWSIALYTIYHDYGCRYLNFILDSTNAPDASMVKLLNSSRSHVYNVQRILRNNVAHGVLDTYSVDRLKRIFFAREGKTINQMTDEKWYEVAERIRKESNALVDNLYKWADGYGINTRNIRRKFGSSDEFKQSIDSRIMFDTLDNDYCVHGGTRAKKILESSSAKLPNQKLEVWRNEVSSLFLRNELETPKDIIAKLKTYLFEVHQPQQSSSATIGETTGFDLSLLLK